MKEFKVNVAPLISRLELISKKRLTGFLSGEFKSILRGRGLEFHGYRKYNSAEDDAKMIDWKASLRSRYLVVKELIEERNNNVMFLLDVGSSMSFGSTDKLKNEYAIELFAAMAHALLAEGDSVGVTLYCEKVRKFITPNIGAKQLYMMLKELTDVKNYEGQTDFASSLHEFGAMMPRASIIIMVSDFLNLRGDWLKELKLLNAKHEVICIVVNDPRDLKLPKETGEIMVKDYATGEHLLINTELIADDYEKIMTDHIVMLKNTFKENLIDHIFVDTSQPFTKIMYTFFKERAMQAGGS